MNEDEQISKAWTGILKINWQIHDRHGQSYLSPEEYNNQSSNISILRRLKAIKYDNRIVINSILKEGLNHYYELKEYLRNEPRREAQKFIGNKKIRKFIFKRDKYMCLKCNTKDNLTIDHINPVFHGGLNKLYNLQTLCRSCNSSKSSNFKDYR